MLRRASIRIIHGSSEYLQETRVYPRRRPKHGLNRDGSRKLAGKTGSGAKRTGSSVVILRERYMVGPESDARQYFMSDQMHHKSGVHTEASCTNYIVNEE